MGLKYPKSILSVRWSVGKSKLFFSKHSMEWHCQAIVLVKRQKIHF